MKDKNPKNKKDGVDINEILADISKKYILTEDEIKGLLERASHEIVLPVSIFNDKLGMLEAASLYLKDKLGLSFKDIAKHLKRDYKTIWTSYTKAKKKI